MKQLEIKLSKGQGVALSNLGVWADDVTSNDDSSLFATLVGSAGTGKTFVINQFLQQHKDKRICVTAPTHKAKIVVQRMTAKPAMTIQALCGLRLDVNLANFNVNQPKFKPIASPKMDNYNIVIVDEASMIDKILFGLLKTTAIKTNTKLLYVGDRLQLPPVKESLSVIFTDTDIIYKNELTEIIRQEDTNPLLPLLGTMRDDIENLTDKYKMMFEYEQTQIVDGQGYEVYRGKKDINAMIDKLFLSDEFKKNKGYVKYMAFTNKAVEAMNKYARNLVLNNPTEAILVGDSIMGYESIVDKKNDQTGDISYKLINSEDYVVVNVDELLTNAPHGVTGRFIMMKSLTTSDLTTVYIVDKSGYEAYSNKYLDLWLDAQNDRRKFVSFYDFKKTYLLMETLIHPSLPERENKMTKSLDYGYAITIHKSQGSTYDNIIVNNQDIRKYRANRSKTEAKKLLYVACSRPSNIAHIID